MIHWSRFVEIVRAHQRFVLTSHVRPDCDALGSELAMAGILESLGKEVLICNAFVTPPGLGFVDPEGRLKQLGADVTAEQLESYDVLMVLDTSAWVQLGAMADVLRTTRMTKMVLDHHQSSDDLGAEAFKDTTAEATGRLVIDAADALGVALSTDIAHKAFLALTTDTGWFRFSSTQASTMRLAARLIDAGVRPDAVYRDLYENDTHGRLRLIGRTLSRTETELDGRLIYSWLELSDFQAAGAHASESEDIINMMLGVSGTQVAVLLVEQKAGGFKVSFRSRCDVDCSRVAEQFGGGGHRKAAGATVHEGLEAARAKVLDVVRAAMQ